MDVFNFLMVKHRCFCRERMFYPLVLQRNTGGNVTGNGASRLPVYVNIQQAIFNILVEQV